MIVKIAKRLDGNCCGKGGCPAILRAEDGDIIVIGMNVTGQIENLTEFGAACGKEEYAVKIPKAVFESLKK